MKLFNLSLTLLLFCGVSTLSAASFGPCPTATNGSSTYLTSGGLCNVVITFNANGSIMTQVSNSNPYDGADDNLVGIVNNTTKAITSVFLSSLDLSNGGLFAFDDDGICSFTLSPSACNNGATGYEGGPNVSFSGIAANHGSGTVNFGAGGIAPGGTNFFSLEEPPDLNLQVGPGTPEPASVGLMGLGLCCGVFLLRRRSRKS